jgi:Holliday junction resolvase RusA-like endonuclease
MQFTLSLPPPPTHQAALRILKTRDGRQFIGKMARSNAVKWCKAATLLIKAEAGRRGYQMVAQACYVNIRFFYPHTKESKREATRGGYVVVDKATRPDLDNLAKGVLDCLVDAGVLKDDGLICQLSLAKYYSDIEQVTIDIVTYDPDNQSAQRTQ